VFAIENNFFGADDNDKDFSHVIYKIQIGKHISYFCLFQGATYRDGFSDALLRSYSSKEFTTVRFDSSFLFIHSFSFR
jgi:hypothetical protein